MHIYNDSCESSYSCLLQFCFFFFLFYFPPDLPDFAAFKHARVHNVGTHEGGLYSLHLLSQQLMGQGLVEAHRRKLTGAVILDPGKSTVIH